MYSFWIACRHNNDWEDGFNGDLIPLKNSKVTHWMNLPDEPTKPTLKKEL